MTRNVRRHNSIQNTFKDYLVPIIGGVITIVLIYSFFSGDPSQNISQETNKDQAPTSIVFDDSSTEAYIAFPEGNKVQINESNSLYKGETIIVKQGTLKLTSTEGNTIRLNKVAELSYKKDGSYALKSSDAWFTLWIDTNISMRYANIESPAESILSLTQNEVTSTIYVLNWSAKVTNLAGNSTLLIKGQKINISRLETGNKEINLSDGKWDIDSYFKGTDWFIENEWHIILQKEDSLLPVEETLSWSTSTQVWASGKYIQFDTLKDEMSTQKNTLTISGDILSLEVGSITINNIQTSISTATKSFTLENLQLPQTVNDLVVKVYNTNKNIVEKRVYTVYSSGTNKAAINNTVTPSNNSQGITKYDVDATDFGFSAPSTNGKFSTTTGEITIRWYTNAEGVSQVKVNGFKLASFNGTTWRYHAFTRFETLEEGTNQYRVDYYWEDGSIIYTDYYTIVKKSSATIKAPETKEEELIETPTEKLISDEA